MTNITTLSPRQANRLWKGADHDMVLPGGRGLVVPRSPQGNLIKAAKAESNGRRRVVPNVWATFQGKGQPREGFLSTEVMRACYLRSEVIRACVDTLIELVCGVDWSIRAKDEEHSRWLRQRRPEQYQEQQRRISWLESFFKRPNVHQSLDSFHRVWLRDLLIYDAAAYEIVTAEYEGRSLPVELGVVAGDTVEIETDDAGMPVRYWQSYNVLGETQFEPHEICYAKMNPVSWSPYGVSPIETAHVAIASDLNANKYNADFFEKNGIPPALLAVMGLGPSEFRRVMAAMRQTSVDNPWNIHAFKAPNNPDGTQKQIFDLIPLSQISNKDMQFTELLTHVVRRITMLYRISPSQIGFTDEVTGGIGSGVAETQVDLMESKGVAPLLGLVEESHTGSVIEGVLGWGDLEFAFIQSGTPREQQERANDAQELTSSVMTINEFRSKWGGRDGVDWGDLPLAPPQGWQPPMSPDQMQQQLMQAQQGGGAPGQEQQGSDAQQGQQQPAPSGDPALPPAPPSPPGMAKAASRGPVPGGDGQGPVLDHRRIVIRW
ncbi:MAG: phage portal protein [Cyanobacteria bacterium]|nr:phage portal protein [Cyanobacteriota bacterium]